MDKSPDAFRTISEVAEDLNVPQHVLRFWESKFNQIRPMKRGGGRRYYRPNDVELLRGIRHLLYGEGYTIRGVQKLLKDRGIATIAEIGRTSAGQEFDPANIRLHDQAATAEPSLNGEPHGGAGNEQPALDPIGQFSANPGVNQRQEPGLSFAFEEELTIIEDMPAAARYGEQANARHPRDEILRAALADLAEAHCILTADR